MIKLYIVIIPSINLQAGGFFLPFLVVGIFIFLLGIIASFALTTESGLFPSYCLHFFSYLEYDTEDQKTIQSQYPLSDYIDMYLAKGGLLQLLYTDLIRKKNCK